MNQALRLLAAAAIVAATAWSAYRVCILPYQCNQRELRTQKSVMDLFNLSNETTARIAARQAVEDVDRCLSCAPTNVDLYMIRAAALRMLGRVDEAEADYRRALRVDRRAELYLNLGITELDAGRTEQAADALTTAVFLVYAYVEQIPRPMQDRIRSTVTPTYLRIQQHRATPELMEQLRARVTRDPL